MNSRIISKLVSRGITPQHPHFAQEVDQLEREETRSRQDRLKQGSLRGAKRITHLTTPREISTWLNGDGRAIRLGLIRELEIWERGESLMLAVSKPNWEVYAVTKAAGFYQLLHRIA